jgi:hypothetical protein
MAAKSPGAVVPELALFTAKTENVFVAPFSMALSTCADFQSFAPFPDAPIGWPFTQRVNWLTAVIVMEAEVAVFPFPGVYVFRKATFPVVAPDVQIHEADSRPLSDSGSRLIILLLCVGRGLSRRAWTTCFLVKLLQQTGGAGTHEMEECEKK